MGQLVFQATLGGTTALVGPNTAATNSLTIPNASGALAWSTSALTSGRVTYAGAGGLLQDSANMLFDGSTLTTLNTAYTGTLTGGTGVVNLGSGQFYKDASGNIGVGTASPARKLDVRGSLGMQVNEDSAGTKVISIRSDYAGAGPAINVTTNDPLLFLTNNTERMRIDSSGNLLVGTTTVIAKTTIQGNANANGLQVIVPTFDYQCLGLHNTATAGNNIFAVFLTDASSFRGSITYNRTAGLVAFNTTSDYRAKDIISPVLNSGEVIDSVPVYMGKMKDATQARPMFIAHETPDYAHTGEKDAVDKDGNPVYQQMDASSLVPVLWAEIQSLRKRLTALEAQLGAK